MNERYQITCKSLDGYNHTIKSSKKAYTHATFTTVSRFGNEEIWFAGYTTDELKASKKRAEGCNNQKSGCTFVKNTVVKATATAI